MYAGGAVLCYHAVTDRDCPSASVANIPVHEVKEQLSLLRAYREIVPLSQLLDRHAAGRSVDGLASITFDDAYASLGSALVPWLREQSIPCSIFVTTGASERGSSFWWDRVDDAYPQVSPERWTDFENRIGLPRSYVDGQPKEHGRLRPLRQYVLAEFSGRWPEKFEPALRDLEDLVQPTRQRAMSFDEIDRVATWHGVEIGVHTCEHPVLPLLEDAKLIDEVHRSWNLLRDRFTRTIPVLAIPFGLFDARTLRLSKAAGMRASLTLANRLLRATTSELGVPRLSMTRSMPSWKQHLRWSGLLDLAAQLRNGTAGHEADFPALPSPTT